MLKIKLLPSADQSKVLLETIKKANDACGRISEIAWNKRVFNQFKLHHETYYEIKNITGLRSQMVVRCIAKVANAYKLDKKVKRNFKDLGAIGYDKKTLTYRGDNIASIWTTQGRLRIPFVCHNKHYFSCQKGEACLVYRKNKFYLHQYIEVPAEPIKEANEFIGCDFGQTDICTLSDGTSYSSTKIKTIRKRYNKVRSSIQSKGTKSSRRLLKRLKGREFRFVSITNHTISKQIVAKAKSENKGIAIENLVNIRNTAKTKSRAQKTELNRWTFFQLRQYITYKARLNGIKLFVIPPAYTSQMCSECYYIGDRKGKRFKCKNCGNKMDADHNAAKNIATWGRAVNQPERPILYCRNVLHN
jgi:putative transposase